MTHLLKTAFKHHPLYLILVFFSIFLFFFFPSDIFLIVVLILIFFWLKDLYIHHKIEKFQPKVSTKVDQFMSAEDKSAYLKSKRWKQKKLLTFMYHGKQCKKCGNTGKLDIHHLHYKTLGNENPQTDLVPLCRSCHSKLHEQKGYDRRTNYSL